MAINNALTRILARYGPHLPADYNIDFSVGSESVCATLIGDGTDMDFLFAKKYVRRGSARIPITPDGADDTDVIELLSRNGLKQPLIKIEKAEESEGHSGSPSAYAVSLYDLNT